METWDAIRARVNVRQYADRLLPDAALRQILEVGRRSPSSRNWQPWDFVVVTDREQLRELSTVWRGGGHIADSAAAIAVALPTTLDERERGIAMYDVGQCTMAMQIIAADLGIHSRHSAIGDHDLARSILGLPENRYAAYLIDFGYPADRPLKPIRRPNRRPFDEVVHRGRY